MFSKILERLLFSGIAIFIVLYFLRDKGIKSILIGNKHEISPEEIEVTFSDALGIDEAKDELREIVEFLKDPEKFSRLGGHLPKVIFIYYFKIFKI